MVRLKVVLRLKVHTHKQTRWSQSGASQSGASQRGASQSGDLKVVRLKVVLISAQHSHCDLGFSLFTCKSYAQSAQLIRFESQSLHVRLLVILIKIGCELVASWQT